MIFTHYLFLYRTATMDATGHHRSSPSPHFGISTAIMVWFGISMLYSQEKLLHGLVIDAVTRKPVTNATVTIPETGRRLASDTAGYFRIVAPLPDRFTVIVHHLAYTDIERPMNTDRSPTDIEVFALQPHSLPAQEIVIQSSRYGTADAGSPFPSAAAMHHQLVQKPAATVSDALKSFPGVYLVRDGTWATGISLRGMSRSGIVMLVDNARIETAQDIGGALSLVNIHELERIEIVRSPGAALYGTGAFGGIVHLITKRPSLTDTPVLSAAATEEFTGVNKGHAHFVSIERSGQSVGIRLSGSYRKASSIMTPEGIMPNSQFTDFSVGGSLAAPIAATSRVLLSYQKSQADDTGIPGGSPFAETASARYTLAERELMSGEYTMTEFSRYLPSMHFRLSRQVIKRNVEVRPSPAVTLTPHAIHTTTSAQFTTQVFPSDFHQAVAGAEVWIRELVSKRERINTAAGSITGERPVPPSSFLSAGIFAQDEWKIFPDHFSLTFGARYDWIRITNQEVYQPDYVLPIGIINVSLPGRRQLLWEKETNQNSSWSAHAGCRYDIAPTIDVSLLVSKAFRSPSLEERFQFIDIGSSVRLGNPDLAPEQCWSSNAGFHYRSDNFSARADVFYNHFTDLVTEVPTLYESRSAYVKKNIGKARIYGFEVSQENIFTSWFMTRYSASYVRGEDKTAGTNLPQIAPFNGTAEGIVYWGNTGSWSLTATVSAPHNNRSSGEPWTPGSVIFDTSVESFPVQWDHVHLILRAGMENILNKSYRNHLSSIRGPMRSEPGRNIFLSATLSL